MPNRRPISTHLASPVSLLMLTWVLYTAYALCTLKIAPDGIEPHTHTLTLRAQVSIFSTTSQTYGRLVCTVCLEVIQSNPSARSLLSAILAATILPISAAASKARLPISSPVCGLSHESVVRRSSRLYFVGSKYVPNKAAELRLLLHPIS